MQTNSRCRLTREIEISSSGDYFHQLYACKPYQLAKICPSVYQGSTLQEGEFGKNGSVIVWNYTHDGKAAVTKEIIENLDMENKTITYRVIEGDISNHYSNFLIHLHVMPKAAGNVSIVKWTFEYEKLNEDVPEPTSLMDIIVHASKQVADHIKA